MSATINSSDNLYYRQLIDSQGLGSPFGSSQPPKFKIGDKVRCIPGHDASFAGAGYEPGEEFVITEIVGTGTFIYFHEGLGVYEPFLEPVINNQGASPVPTASKPLLKKDITIGMAVTVYNPFISTLPKDSLGQVVSAGSDGIGVSFEGWNGGHDLKGTIDETSGHYFTITGFNQFLRPLVPAKVNFDSVILADDKKEQIIHALKQIDNHKLIFIEWGFNKTFEKGKGISMLFYGPPGTGKTLMAQAIAHKLDYTLKVVSNADIQSSVPGEAERNIRKYFKESKNKTVLLFDECDSLIHTRSSVGAILGAQINELLSQLERFEGVTVFTTNRLGILDEAVNRRLSIKVEFAMPSLEERVKIWQRMFPDEAPLARNIKWKDLAKHEIAGGHIKNAVLRAAREAATEDLPDKDKTITMEHLTKGLEQEVESTAQFNKAKHQYEGRYRWGQPGAEIEEGTGEGMGQDLKMIRKSVKEMRHGQSK